MTELVPFDYEGHQVRVIVIDDEPWLVAADIARALGYGSAKDALRMVDESEKGRHLVPTPGGEQQVSILSEGGMYELLFLSRRPDAKRFKARVKEILREIRRTGSYAPIPAQRAELSRLELIEIASSAELERLALAQQVAELAAPARAWETLATADGDYAVADAAKILSRDPGIQVGRDRLFTILRDLKWCYRQGIDNRHRVYQTAIERRRLSELAVSHFHPRTGELILDPPQVRVTVKGLLDLHKHLGGTAELDVRDRRIATSDER